MNKAESTGKKVVWVLDKLLGAFFACAMFLILLVGLYALWDSKMVYAEADSAQWEAFRPTSTNAEGFEELREENPDVWGWLHIYGTKINNPLLHNEENHDLYLNHDAKGRPSSPGALYIEKPFSNTLSDFNTIIYGHHMANDLMFGGLDHFDDQSYLDEHPYGTVSYVDSKGQFQTSGIEVVGLIHTDAYDSSLYKDPIVSSSSQQAYVGALSSQMATKRDVEWNNNQILVLSTCASGSTNARTVVVCYVEDEVHEDTFVEEVREGIGLDELSGLFGFPWLGWVGLILFVCIVILLVIWHMDKRRQAKKDRES